MSVSGSQFALSSGAGAGQSCGTLPASGDLSPALLAAGIRERTRGVTVS